MIIASFESLASGELQSVQPLHINTASAPAAPDELSGVNMVHNSFSFIVKHVVFEKQ